MIVLFIGGPLDGELRKVGIRTEGTHEIAWSHGLVIEGERYFISNGIARHESVGEEEVARRVYQWRRLTTDEGLADIEADVSRGLSLAAAVRNAGITADELRRFMDRQLAGMPVADDLEDFTQRYMVPQLPPEARNQ